MSNSSYAIQFFFAIIFFVAIVIAARRVTRSSVVAPDPDPVKWDLDCPGVRVRVDREGKFIYLECKNVYYSDERLAWKTADPNAPVEQDWRHPPEKPVDHLSGVKLEGRMPLIGLSVHRDYSVSAQMIFSSSALGREYVFSVFDKSGKQIELPAFKGAGFVYISADLVTDGDTSFDDLGKFSDWLNRLAKEAEKT